jgi:hypothetical protein
MYGFYFHYLCGAEYVTRSNMIKSSIVQFGKMKNSYSKSRAVFATESLSHLHDLCSYGSLLHIRSEISF